MSIGKLPNVCNKTMRSRKALATLTQDGFARIASAELTHTKEQNMLNVVVLVCRLETKLEHSQCFQDRVQNTSLLQRNS